MIRQAVFGVLAVTLIAVGLAGCGMSPGGNTTAAGAPMESVGPAAPAAARSQPTVAPSATEAGAHVAVFVHPTGAGVQSVTLSLQAVSLTADGKPIPLELAQAAAADVGGFQLLAHGDLPPGRYAGLTLQPQLTAHTSSLVFATDHASAVLRLPHSIDLQLDPIEVHADDWRVAVVTLDLSEVRAGAEVPISARRFRAGELPATEAGELKGQVAPAASLARVYALWAGTGTPVAVTQPDAFTGEYALSGLPPGPYRLQVSAAGYQAYQGPDEPIVVAAGKTAQAPAVTLTPGKPVEAK